MQKKRTIFAPAKINLFLHVTGRQSDGYHLLDSLVVFADVGDEVLLEPATDFAFDVSGPFAGQFSAAECDCSPNSGNLLVRAVWQMAEAARKKPDVKITLKKNLPLASGVGGGSADAAAAIWGLLEHWNVARQTPFLESLMMGLGADIPACLDCCPVRLKGKGDILENIEDIPEMPIVLVNPGQACKTGMVFSLFPGPYRNEITMPDSFVNRESLIEFLRASSNDLTDTAIEIVPEIAEVLRALHESDSALVSRMCGSGSTCYALFETQEQARHCAGELCEEHPDWWVRTGWINRPQRY